MSNTILPQPTQINVHTVSQETLAARSANILLNSAKFNYQQMVRAQKDAIKIVWENADGLTPQQVCNALGTKASKLFDFHAALTDCIIYIAERDGVQPDIAAPTNMFAHNPDGTITISDQPYQPA